MLGLSDKSCLIRYTTRRRGGAPHSTPLQDVPRFAMRILLAQHRPSLSAQLEVALSDHGLEVLEVVDGVEALNALTSGPVDALVIDIELPLIDGLQLLLRLRSDPSWEDVPAILTGGQLPWSREEARSRGPGGPC